jgi:hypothetical protein
VKPYASAWSNQATARKAVRFETRLEFAMEGHRFFDLVRWGIAAETLNAYNAVESTKRVYKKGGVFVKVNMSFSQFLKRQLTALRRMVNQPLLKTHLTNRLD